MDLGNQRQDAPSSAPPRRGSGAAAPRRWRPRGSTSSSTPAAPRRWRRRRRRSAGAARGRGDGGRRRHHHRGRAARRCWRRAPEADILVTNAGGPPPGVWSDWSREDFLKAIDANMLTPIALMQAVLPGMIARGWGRVVNITSGAVKSPIPALGLSNTARAGLTGFVAGTSRQVAAQRGGDQQPAAGHPRHRPGRRRSTAAVVKARGHRAWRRRAAERAATIPARRYGTRGGVRRGLRLPLLGARGLHRRAEHRDRRRRRSTATPSEPPELASPRAGCYLT